MPFTNYTRWEELADSPKIKVDRKGGSAVRKFKVAWTDVNTFIEEFFPQAEDLLNRNSPNSNVPETYFMPGMPWLMVNDCEIDPFTDYIAGQDAGLVNNPINTYEYAIITVNYTIPEMDQRGDAQGAGGGGDKGGNGPGGKDGSTQGNDVTFLNHKLSIGAEMLQYPNGALEWENPASRAATPIAGFVAGASEWLPKDVNMKPAATNSIVVPHIQHTLTWSQVMWAPWAAIRACIGRVNGYRIMGAPEESLLFLGAEAEREYTNRIGWKPWKLDYKFSEKNYNNDPTQAQGWNYFLRPETGRFERVVKKVRRTASGVPSGGQVASAVGASGTTITLFVGTDQVDDLLKGPFPFLMRVGNEVVKVTNALSPTLVVGPPVTYLTIDGVSLPAPVLAGSYVTLQVIRAVNNSQGGSHAVNANAYMHGGSIYEQADFGTLFPENAQTGFALEESSSSSSSRSSSSSSSSS